MNCDNPLQPEIQPEDPIVIFDGVDGQAWTDEEMAAVRSGAWAVAQALYEAGGGQFSSPREAFMAVYGGQVTFYKKGTDPYPEKTIYAEWIGNNRINVYTDIYNARGESKIPTPNTGGKWAAHELG
ncbi:MAG: hypothetical protein HC804_03385, partial [Anaerolineae bacterium]|nr:hypothetical protein [Anaerolineae bacterium]